MAFFSPLSALTAFGGGIPQGMKQVRDDAAQNYDLMGIEALGRAFQQPQQAPTIAPIPGIGQGPQAPFPGQASVPAGGPSPPGPSMGGGGPPAPTSGGAGGPVIPPGFGAPAGNATQDQLASAFAALRAGQGQPIGGYQPPPPPQAPPQIPPQARAQAMPPPQAQPQQQPPPNDRMMNVPAQQAPMGQFDLQSLAQRIQQANPGLPPQAFMSALMRAAPLLNMQGRIELARAQQQATQSYRQSELGIQQGRLDEERRKTDLLYGTGGGGGEDDSRIAQGIANGQIAPFTGYALRSPRAQKIMSEVFQINPNYRASDFAGEQAASRASASAEPRALANALTQLTKSKAAINSFENTAIKNGRVLVDLANKVDQTGVPVIEKWIRAGRQATGDPDVARFHAQLQVYRNEVAKILTNPNLTGQLTDTARREAAEFLGGGASAAQIVGLIQLFEADFGRRSQAIDEEISSVRDQLKRSRSGLPPEEPKKKSEAPAASTAGAVQPPAEALKQLKEGFITTFGNGQKWTLENGQPKQVQ